METEQHLSDYVFGKDANGDNGGLTPINRDCEAVKDADGNGDEEDEEVTKR